ncbi:MAG: hypothetical protein ABSH41_00320 [Syntrophobacteraceae bacterium]
MTPLDENLPVNSSRALKQELKEVLELAENEVLKTAQQLADGEIGWDENILKFEDFTSKVGARLFWIGHHLVKAYYREEQLMDRLDDSLPKLKN